MVVVDQSSSVDALEIVCVCFDVKGLQREILPYKSTV